ncbi:MAG: hypothetical protein HFJ55_00695 [Clostridia bacterium]|nr:hypothetical protein [Clostridia bacterium]
MTLKEELSISRRKAIAENAELEAQADEEMRKVIHEYIEPILRLMHEEHPFESKLHIQVKVIGSIWFEPMLEVKKPEMCDKMNYSPEIGASQLMLALPRVSLEFDLDVQPGITNAISETYIVTMTLED